MGFTAECAAVWIDITDGHRVTGDNGGFRNRPRVTVTGEHEDVVLEFEPGALREFIAVAEGLTKREGVA